MDDIIQITTRFTRDHGIRYPILWLLSNANCFGDC